MPFCFRSSHFNGVCRTHVNQLLNILSFMHFCFVRNGMCSHTVTLFSVLTLLHILNYDRMTYFGLLNASRNITTLLSFAISSRFNGVCQTHVNQYILNILSFMHFSFIRFHISTRFNRMALAHRIFSSTEYSMQSLIAIYLTHWGTPLRDSYFE